MEEIETAIRRVHADSVLEHLEQGMDTDVGEGGGRLSLGERQLLSFARTLAYDPAILILDEATANIDTESEQWIQEAVSRLMKGRTSIMVAHRLSTIRDADLIVVLDQGRIVEQGSHDELLARKQKYYDLYMTQYAGFAT